MGRFYLSTTMLFLTISASQYARINRPVVDLFGSANIPQHKDVTIAPTTPADSCPRINQALYNEVYEIIKKEKNSTQIIIPWAIYGYDAFGNPQNSYWIRNSDFIITYEKPQEPAPLNNSIDKRALFVQLIRKLAQHNPPIPYVWGGGSFIEGEKQENMPFTGYDCSNLILRCAHALQIPYYFKTTSALEKYGKLFTRHDKLEAGDLIWLPGHVIIITDINKVEVTESSGYFNKVGYVRTEKLSNVLQNMHSWHDLLNAHFNKKTVTRLDIDRQPYNASPVKIFKLF